MNGISAVMVQSPLRIVPLAMGQAFDTGALGAIGSSRYNVEGNNEESLALIKKRKSHWSPRNDKIDESVD